MKYFSSFQNKNGKDFSISSMEDYSASEADIIFFEKVLSDLPVRKYITDEAMITYGFRSIRSLTEDILKNSALRWAENKEKRFLVRDQNNSPVGMIGVTLRNLFSAELWYYKASSVESFMFQALNIVLEFLKQEGVQELVADVDPDNIRSVRILSSIGFHKDKQNECEWYKRL